MNDTLDKIKASIPQGIKDALKKVKLNAGSTARAAGSHLPVPVKDMIKSVDWKTLAKSEDARNALIGSALGGLLLGGAGLAQERDPEESRLAPVGDALLGALAGGVAGYSLPKGLAMFRAPGYTAPDGDRLNRSYWQAALKGALGGSVAFTPFALRDIVTAAGRARDNIRQTLASGAPQRSAQINLRAAAANLRRGVGGTADQLREAFSVAQARAAALSDTGFEAALSRFKRLARSAKAAGDTVKYDRYRRAIRALRATRAQYEGPTLIRSVTHPIINTRQILGELSTGTGNRVTRTPNMTIKEHLSTLIRNRFAGRTYGRRPVGKMVLRGGRWAGAGALATMLAQYLIGQDAQPNFAPGKD